MTEDELEELKQHPKFVELRKTAISVSSEINRRFDYDELSKEALYTFVKRLMEINHAYMLDSAVQQQPTGRSVLTELASFRKTLERVTKFSESDRNSPKGAARESLGQCTVTNEFGERIKVYRWLDDATKICDALDDLCNSIDPDLKISSEWKVTPGDTAYKSLVGTHLVALYEELYPQGIKGGTNREGDLLDGPMYLFVCLTAYVWGITGLTNEAIRKHIER